VLFINNVLENSYLFINLSCLKRDYTTTITRAYTKRLVSVTDLSRDVHALKCLNKLSFGIK
jgi:hypothetical protein